MPKPSDTGNVKKRCDFKAPKDHPRRGISEKHPNGERYRQNLNVIAAESDRLAPQGYEKRRSAADITREALDAFRQQRPKVAANRNLAFLRAAFNWAVVDGLVPRSPFRVGDVAVVKLAREEARTRRLQGDEEERLLLAANGRRPLIVGALETGCRLGELLSLQWSQVRFSPGAELFLEAQKTKAKKDRRIPISTALRTVLDARRNDLAGGALTARRVRVWDEIGHLRPATNRSGSRHGAPLLSALLPAIDPQDSRHGGPTVATWSSRRRRGKVSRLSA